MAGTKALIEAFYRTRIGGTLDTLALLCGIGAGIMTTPLLADTAPKHLSSLLAGIFAAYFAQRFLAPAMSTAILESNVEIASDHTPDELDEQEWDGFVIGYTTDSAERVVISDANLMRHLLIVGMTGVGKTVLGMFMMYQQIMRGGGLLFVDGKIDSDNLQTIWQYVQIAGRPQDLRVINPGNPEQSNTYNPILFGDPDEVAARILSLIPSTENNPGADHYRQEANQGVATLVAALQRAGLAYNMIDISILLMSSAALLELEAILAQSRNGRDSEELKNYRLFIDKFRAPDPRTGVMSININKLKDTFGGIGGRLYMFGTGNFGRVMNTYDPDVRLFDSIMQRHIVYVPLPTMGKTEAASNFGKMLVGDLRTAISWIQALPQEDRPNPPFFCFLDELTGYATAAAARPFEQARSARLILCGAIQNLANLRLASQDLEQSVLANTYTKIYFKLANHESAEACAEAIGKEKGVLRSLSDTSTDSSSASFLRATPESSSAKGQGFAMGEREQEEFIVSPDDLKKLDSGEIVMTYGGEAIYNLRVPMLTVSPEAAEAYGPPMLTRGLPRMTLEGAGFSLDPGRFMQGLASGNHG